MQLAAGDLLEFPPGMQWDTPPGVTESPPAWIAASDVVDGQRLYVTIDTRGSPARFVAVDDRTFRVAVAGPVLLYALDADGNDHSVALTPAGDLHLDPAPVAGKLAVVYASGQAVDLKGMAAVGQIPAVRRTYPTEFVFTMCDAASCRLSYRVGPLVAPVSGATACRQGDEFDLDTGTVRLLFRDAGTLHNNPTWTGPPASACGESRPVRAGEVITQSFVHYLVSAVSETDEPLSVAVTEDGTLYVGHTSTVAACPPCRGS